MGLCRSFNVGIYSFGVLFAIIYVWNIYIFY